MASKIQASQISYASNGSWYKRLYTLKSRFGANNDANVSITAGTKVTHSDMNSFINKLNALENNTFGAYAAWGVYKPSTVTQNSQIAAATMTKIENMLQSLEALNANNTTESVATYSTCGDCTTNNTDSQECETNATYNTDSQSCSTYSTCGTESTWGADCDTCNDYCETYEDGTNGVSDYATESDNAVDGHECCGDNANEGVECENRTCNTNTVDECAQWGDCTTESTDATNSTNSKEDDCATDSTDSQGYDCTTNGQTPTSSCTTNATYTV